MLVSKIAGPLPVSQIESAPGGQSAQAEHVTIDGDPYLRIRNVDAMEPFLMNVVSNGDHWLFVGSNSPFTAGRIDPDHAIFPYQTADKLLRHANSSGALTVMRVRRPGIAALWEPWQATPRIYQTTRNLYKHAYGTVVVFEEINGDLGLRFAWSLTASEKYGIVRRCTLENLRDDAVSIDCLDGWHQILPAGVTQDTFNRYSYLAAAYMRHECVDGLGIYTLNSRISDRPEPGECLRAACAWTTDRDCGAVLLTDRQVDAFRRGIPIRAEVEARGEFGAYLVSRSIDLQPRETREWLTVVATGLDHGELLDLHSQLNEPAVLHEAVIADAKENTAGLRRRIAGADGLQASADRSACIHHFANVLFNCMRGGTFLDSYTFPTSDFSAFLSSRNRALHARHFTWMQSLPETMRRDDLLTRVQARGDAQLARLAREYLPLAFGRRHGDPSRPWNRFTVRTKDRNGRPIFGYQGNWRDIFQNWESLAQSYPGFLGSMIAVFLNASTADGYNPYRITREGIDWEVHDPEDPWSHIGYWGDHQIVYLLRLLESLERFEPGTLSGQLGERAFAYAVVPYEIGDFAAMLRDPKNTIVFNDDRHKRLIARAEELGNDAKLLADESGEVRLASLAEKLLVPLLAKLSNLVPGGGIWLNTQRPEWNDANNALAGWGLSVVTTCHLRRYLVFLDKVFAASASPLIELSASVAAFLEQLRTPICRAPMCSDDAERFQIVRELGAAGEAHRKAVYNLSLGGPATMPVARVREFIAAALAAIDATIRANRRSDGLTHSYNLLGVNGERAAVRNLNIMLEGQVALLSSGVLSAGEALEVAKALHDSKLYRADQHSYLLYPDRAVPPFLSRNTLPSDWPAQAPLLCDLLAAGDRSLVLTDKNGDAHFHGDLTNAADLNARLDRLASDARWCEAVAHNRGAILGLWEAVFNHSAFTGRSGAMFAFEGLGSIYWHMVAKLLLAIQECHARAIEARADQPTVQALQDAYHDVRLGLGFTKTPDVYGAFPTDPYSHSPRHRGAQQPGMTGQVKEEILTRFGELGVEVAGGCLSFAPRLLSKTEFFAETHLFSCTGLDGEETTWKLPPESLAFTVCQTPVCYRLADAFAVTIEQVHNGSVTLPGNVLPRKESRSIFARTGEIARIVVTIPRDVLRA